MGKPHRNKRYSRSKNNPLNNIGSAIKHNTEEDPDCEIDIIERIVNNLQSGKRNYNLSLLQLTPPHPKCSCLQKNYLQFNYALQYLFRFVNRERMRMFQLGDGS